MMPFQGRALCNALVAHSTLLMLGLQGNARRENCLAMHLSNLSTKSYPFRLFSSPPGEEFITEDISDKQYVGCEEYTTAS